MGRGREKEKRKSHKDKHEALTSEYQEAQQRANAAAEELQRLQGPEGPVARQRAELAAAREAEQRKSEEFAQLRGAHEELWGQANTLKSELSAELQTRAALGNSQQELHAVASNLQQQLEAERRGRESDRHKLEEWGEEIKRARDHHRKMGEDLAGELEAERQSRVAEVGTLNQHQAAAVSHAEKFSAELEAKVHAHNSVLAELGQASQAHMSERQRAEELKAHVDAVTQAHEDLFARYSQAALQIDSLKSEGEVAGRERDELRASLQEAATEREARESAPPPGPTQLSVSDVLISIAFEGVPQPLEMRPWDTNLEDVVVRWLGATQRSSMLKDSLVKYLKHLEDTSEQFPVRNTAKLVEVHEEFGV